MDITSTDVEKLVISNGCPETLVVSNEDFTTIYGVYRNVNRDDAGVFVLALNTKIRPVAKADNKLVDLSVLKTSAFGDANGTKK